MIKKLFNKSSSGVKTLFNKGAGDAKQLFTKATKIANQVNNGIDNGLNQASQIANQVNQGVNTGLNKASQVAKQVGKYADKAGLAVTALSPLLAPILGPEMLGAGALVSSVGNASRNAGNYANQAQQMRQKLSNNAQNMIQDAQNNKASLIQAIKPAEMMPEAPAINFA